MQNSVHRCSEREKDRSSDTQESRHIEDKLKAANKCYQEKLILFDKHEERHQEASLELVAKKHLLDAHHEAVQMFDEQIDLNKQLNRSSNFLHEEGSLKENSDTIARRLKTLHAKQEELTKEIRALRAANQDLETEMLKVKEETMALQEECKQHKEWLEGHGISQEEVERMLEASSFTQELLHENTRSWLLPHLDKAEAESMLGRSQSGTFLVRWENNKEHYILSIKFDSKVEHCPIERGDHGYGFAEPYKIHASLVDLVAHYAEHTLEEQCPNLKTRLVKPVGRQTPVIEIKWF